MQLTADEIAILNGEKGETLQSRKRGTYSYVKLSGGKWIISSDISFGENIKN